MTATLSRPLPVEYSPSLQAVVPPAFAATARADWLDAFRGFVMFSLISRSFGFTRLKPFPWAAPIADAFDHAAWVGITPWDMIQPFFMFIVGVAMPYAFAKRRAAGESWGRQFLHALKRTGVLLLLAHVSMSMSGGKPILEFITVLSQIAFTYLIAFFVLGRRWPVQLGVAVGLLAIHTGAHLFWHPTIVDASTGVLTRVGVAGPFAKEANVGWYLDKLILGKTWNGGYATINFVTSAANTIAGVMAGELLRRETPGRRGPDWIRVGILIGVGLGLAVAGLAVSPWVPVIKRIWTSSFALISIGISLGTLAGFYVVARAWPKVPWKLFIVIGANPIFLYLASILFGGHLRKLVGAYTEWSSRFLVDHDFAGKVAADASTQFAMDWIVLGILVYLAFWLYRRKIFIRV